MPADRTRARPLAGSQRSVKQLATGMMWGEGIRWHRNSLWLSDTQASRLWTDAYGGWRSFDLASPSNGLWFLPDGRLVGAMMHQRRVGQWDGSRWRQYADLTAVAAGPLGDMVGDSHGNLYIDDVAFNASAGQAPVPGRIIMVRPDRSAAVAADDIEFPNGLALVDDERTLVVAQTAARRLSAFDVGPGGTLGTRRLYADLGEMLGADARPDGIWAAHHGVWVAATEACLVARVSENQVHETISTAPLIPVACCLRDDGSLLATVADTHGLPLLDAIRRRSLSTSVVVIDTDN